jgi:histidinol-phosphate phosphatase family protein
VNGRGAVRARAVLFDRDGTLVHDVPYNGDPERVRPVDGARRALQRLREAGLRIGLVTNQSGVARGLLTAAAVRAVNDELQRQVGAFDTVAVCPHGPADACACRKPAPGLVLRAAEELGLRPDETVVIGDIGADVGAAAAAGARSILVPTPATRQEEVEEAPVVAPDLDAAVDLVLRGLA